MQGAAAVRLTAAVAAAAVCFVASTTAAGPLDTTEVLGPQHDDTCMMCVCRANGRKGECVTDENCTHRDTFGPFCISWPYWVDAGKPVLPGDDKDLPGAFRRCVEEPFCAVQTVRDYMETGPALQDCDRDGTITCRDLMLTHLHGRYNCQDTKDARVDHLMRCLNTTTSKQTTTPSPITPSPPRVPARPGSTSTRPGASPARPGSSPSRPGSSHTRSGGSPYTNGAAPNHLTDSIHFPGGRANPGVSSHGTDGNDNEDSVGGLPSGASRTAFNSLHVGSRPEEFGETEDGFPHGMADPFAPSREMLNAMNTHMREIQNTMNNHMQNFGNTMRHNLNIPGMGGNIPRNPYPQPNGGGVGGSHGPDWS